MRRIAVIFVFLMALGCRTGREAEPGPLIRLPILHGANRFRTAVVAVPSPASGSEMRVRVGGEVGKPGIVTLPEGSTAFEAIRAAGGFTSFAHPYRYVELRRAQELFRLLYREKSGAVVDGGWRAKTRPLVWYVLARWNPATRRWEPDLPERTSDFVLRGEDSLAVPRCAGTVLVNSPP